MKTLISALLLTSLLSGQVFASGVLKKSSVAQVISSYKTQVLINNVDQAQAFKNIINNISKNDIGTEDLLAYAKDNSSTAEYNALVDALSYGTDELDAMDTIDSDELAYLATNVLSITQTTGASYIGCQTKAVLGTSAIIIGVVLAIKAVEDYRTYRISTNVPFGTNEEARDNATMYGIYGSLAVVTGAAIFATSCN